MRHGQLFAVHHNGMVADIPNTYEAIKAALDGATMDLVVLREGAEFFVDDEGMINSLPLNVPASLLAERALYGPVVLHGGADDEGETLPPPERAVKLLTAFAAIWNGVLIDAARKGQSLEVRANADTIPPAQIYDLTVEQFDAFLRGEWRPDE